MIYAARDHHGAVYIGIANDPEKTCKSKGLTLEATSPQRHPGKGDLVQMRIHLRRYELPMLVAVGRRRPDWYTCSPDIIAEVFRRWAAGEDLGPRLDNPDRPVQPPPPKLTEEERLREAMARTEVQ